MAEEEILDKRFFKSEVMRMLSTLIEKVDAHDKRFDAIDKRFDAQDKKLTRFPRRLQKLV
jgi:hypothetical protein